MYIIPTTYPMMILSFTNEWVCLVLGRKIIQFFAVFKKGAGEHALIGISLPLFGVGGRLGCTRKVCYEKDAKYSQFYRSFTYSPTIFIILQSFNLRFEVLILHSTTNTDFQTLILLTRTRFMIGNVELLN